MKMYSSKPNTNGRNRNVLWIKRLRKARFLAATTALALFYQLAFPNISLALTGGPASPDFASFEPVATTNMVNEFTGQFVYNIPVIDIPGANGGGYAMSLSYHSGDGPETEASWVGAGWTLNPGCINRIKRGIPDDYAGATVRLYNDVPKNWTVAVQGSVATEIFSEMKMPVGISAAATIRYNNYKGFNISKNLGLSVLSGLFSLGFQFSGGDLTLSPNVNPAAILSLPANIARFSPSFAGSVVGKNTIKITQSATGQKMRTAASNFIGTATSRYIGYLLTEMSGPCHLTQYTGKSTSGSIRATYVDQGLPVSFLSVGANLSYTHQQNVAYQDVNAFGYMYSAYAPSNNTYDDDGNALMDYTVENESTYNPRDIYMPVPTSTPDAYFVSGEGVGGSFRMYNDRIGIFSPNFVESKIDIDMIGFDMHGPNSIGAGYERVKENKLGEQVLTSRSSFFHPGNGGLNDGNTEDFLFMPPGSGYFNTGEDYEQISEGSFFRFNNDLGGSVIYDGNNDPILPSFNIDEGGKPSLPGISPVAKDNKVPAARRNGRASYIGFHSNGQASFNYGGKHPFAYEKNSRIQELAGRYNSYNNSVTGSGIGEISIYNESGNNYVYGLPVYCGGESNITKGITASSSGQYYHTTATTNNTTIGEQYTTPFVSSYLLTQITTPDYIDINFNGPDDSDFGGYTKFIYKPLYSGTTKSSGDFYKWRAPYTGVYYRPNLNSDKNDNMGYYQSGSREVYLLDTIETKTHFATFITEERSDGWSAAGDDLDAAGGSSGVGSGKAMHKLKEIQLYSKSAIPGGSPKLIKTVHFQYDYSAWPGTPNSTSGKLTLKRMWFEYNGVVNAAISPYEFEYTYSNSNYPTQYESIDDAMNISGLVQDPSYSPFIDCWGNYQYDGQNRRNKLQSWVDQTKPNTYDPAAWQLKKIILPSGGEIHLQYEENTYAYVQDRMASVMVSLNGDPDGDASKFYLNLDDLDIDQYDAGEKQRLVDTINKVHKKYGDFIYYKFFYSLYGNSSSDIGDCNGEYIDGFANLSGAGIDGGGVYIQLGNTMPYKTCIDMIQKELGGKLSDGVCSPSPAIPTDPGDNNLLETFRSLTNSFVKKVESEFARIKPLNIHFCKTLNPSLSYFRIPYWKKKGGGVRVKRLLMYNKGIEANTQGLYGTEYIYENEVTGESYGVATNEPAENREENPIVSYLIKRHPQSGKGKLFNGRDVDQFRGPLSMNALPAASIGYSRVIKRNIHQDKYTGTGYSVVDYYTVKDYPFDMYYPVLGKPGVNTTPIQTINPDPKIDFGFFNYTLSSYLNMGQGYCFIQNQMHGQLKAITDYPGSYDLSFYNKQNPPTPVFVKEHIYFEPGESIPMFDFSTYGITYQNPGIETDITVDRRGIQDRSTVTMITADFTVGTLYGATVPYPIVLPAITSESRCEYNTLVTNKVIHYPTILKTIKTLKDGYSQRVDNIAFDPLTSQPVVTRTYDGYDGLALAPYTSGTTHVGWYTQYNVPASSQYIDMGQKAWNENHVYNADAFSVTSSGSEYDINGVNSSGIFHKGDLVAVHASGGIVGLANITATTGFNLKVVAAKRYNANLSVGDSYFKIEVIRSGYTNQLNASMGGFLEYGGSGNLKKSQWQVLAELNKALKDLMTTSATDDSIIIDIRNCADLMSVSDYWAPSCEDFDETPAIYGLPVGFIGVVKHGTKYFLNPLDTNGNRFPRQEISWTSSGYPMWEIYNTAYLSPNDIPVRGTFTFTNPFLNPPIAFSPAPTQVSDWLSFMNYKDPSNSQYHRWDAYGFRFCTTTDYGNITEGVLKASVTTYKDEWDYDTFRYHIPNLNDYETGKRGKWRPYETYVLNDTVINGSNPDDDERIYLGAGISYNFRKAPWEHIYVYHPTIWTRTNKVISYSPNGLSQEENDYYDKPSTAKFGYYGILPYAIAKNAPNDGVRFESFENEYTDHYAEDSLELSANFIWDGHTGRRSFELLHNNLINFYRVKDPNGQGHVVKFWIKTNDGPQFVANNDAEVKVDGTTTLDIKYVTRTGGWALFEAIYDGSGSDGYHTYSIKSKNHDIQIDDIKIQPLTSQMTCYVYDTRTYKLSAILDENHIATLYQYSGEGKLTRKKRETSVGTRVVEEAQYNMPKRRTLKGIGEY